MAKPTLALIPASQGSKVFSVLPSSGVGDFDFSRGSAATRINSQGLIENVASGDSRLEYPLIDGVVNGCPSVLLEPQRTNEWLYSEDFSNAGWTKTNVTITSNNAISPDGTLNASKITDDATSGEHRIRGNTVFISSVANFSIFAKAAEYSTFAIANLSDLFITKFDLSNGTIISTGSGWSDAKIEDYGNGWYKLSAKISANKTCGYGLLNDNGDFVFSGDGTKGVYIWGAQFEQADYPTSYIPTNGTTVTRLADTANGAGDATTFNDSEGVLMAEISALSESGGNRELTLSDGSTSNRIIVQYRDGSNIRIILAKSTGDEFDTGVIPFNTIEKNKIAIKYKTNDFAFWVNGIEIYSDNTGNTFSANTLSKINFDGGTGGNDFYGKTKQLQYFQTVLTDSELEELTSWESFTAMAYGQLYTIE